jgi:hypothetical protein
MAVATELFPLGRLIVTSGADAVLAEAGEEADMFLSRHVSGDWGEVVPARSAANTLALTIRKPLISTHRTSSGRALLVITDPVRFTTHVLLPEEQQQNQRRKCNV